MWADGVEGLVVGVLFEGREVWGRVIEYVGQVPCAESNDKDIPKVVDDVWNLHKAIPWHREGGRV